MPRARTSFLYTTLISSTSRTFYLVNVSTNDKCPLDCLLVRAALQALRSLTAHWLTESGSGVSLKEGRSHLRKVVTRMSGSVTCRKQLNGAGWQGGATGPYTTLWEMKNDDPHIRVEGPLTNLLLAEFAKTDGRERTQDWTAWPQGQRRGRRKCSKVGRLQLMRRRRQSRTRNIDAKCLDPHRAPRSEYSKPFHRPQT